MTVNELIEKTDFKAVSLPDGDKEICGCYIGDLLSWVMGRAEENQAWITIMSNINIVAVASLVDVSCVILSEGVELEESIIETARQKNVNILSSKQPTYETAKMLASVI